MPADDHLGSAEVHAPVASQLAASAKPQPAVEEYNGAAAASTWDTCPSNARRPPCLRQSNTPEALENTGMGQAGSSQQESVVCRKGKEAAQGAHSPQQGSPASAKQLPVSAVHEAAPEQRLHLSSQLSCHETGPAAAASQHTFISPAVTTDQLAPSTAGLSSERLPHLQEAGQILETALASGNEQQLAAGIYVAVRALAVGSGTAAELLRATKVCLWELANLLSWHPAHKSNPLCLHINLDEAI